ncbi:MAG: class B sortase [Oscillospiraceae bacterium]|nr:class B sortase [Oscillospiraceae bacterium]
MSKRNIDNKTKPITRRRWLLIAIFAAGLALVVFSAHKLWLASRDDAAAHAEYDHLREISTAIAAMIASPPLLEQHRTHTTQIDAPATAQDETLAATDMEYPTAEDIPQPPTWQEQIEASLNELADINPDFIGWIAIPGTDVDYPVVRGRDNEMYLHTTFSGTRNPAGAIFMDYRCTDGFDGAAIMIHGHNMRDGSMFSSLRRFLDRDFLNEHADIIIITADGEKLIYRIFNVQRTDAWNRIYTLNFNDPNATAEFFGTTDQILILSTCIGSSSDHARLLIYAKPEISEALNGY